MKKLYLLAILFLLNFSNAQIISGTIFSKEENTPIPYVKIGVEKENIGVISDEKGNFSIDLSKANSSNKIIIEIAGYEKFSQNISDFIKLNGEKIFLKEKFKNIKVVQLVPKKLVDKNWGVNTKTKSVLYSVNPQLRKEQFLGETAIEFNAHKKSKINKINLNIAEFQSNKPVLLRYSIYSEKNGYPNQNIIEDEITVELTPDMIKDGTFTLDVNHYNIWVQGKFFIGIQFLKEFEGRILISAALFRTGFLRKFYSNWEKTTIAAPAINIDVKVNKNAKNIQQPSEIDESYISSFFPDVSKFKEEAENSSFGKNLESGNFFKLKNTQLYFEVYGEGEPVFLLHGNGGSIQDFYQQIPELLKKYKVISIDTRGQGKSIDSNTENFTYKMFAEDIKALSDHLGFQKINIVGWSDGGNTGLEFALKYPNQINKLITIGANAFPKGVDEELLNNFSSKLKVFQFEKNPETFNERRLLKLLVSEPSLTRKDLNRIQNQVLVIAGEKDVIKKEHSEWIAKEIKNSTLTIYKDATHMIPFENAEELKRDIIEFLEK